MLKKLKINGIEYCIVTTINEMVPMFEEYVEFGYSLPDFIVETGRRVLELMAMFNSRSCQLVLGAQVIISY